MGKCWQGLATAKAIGVSTATTAIATEASVVSAHVKNPKEASPPTTRPSMTSNSNAALNQI